MTTDPEDEEITEPLSTLPLAGSMALVRQQDPYYWKTMHVDYPIIQMWQTTEGFHATLQESADDVGLTVCGPDFQRFYATLVSASAALRSAQRFLVRKKARTPKQLEGTGLYEFTIKENMHIIHISQETLTRCGSCIARGVHPDQAWKPLRFRNEGSKNSILVQPCAECKKANKEKKEAERAKTNQG